MGYLFGVAALKIVETKTEYKMNKPKNQFQQYSDSTMKTQKSNDISSIPFNQDKTLEPNIFFIIFMILRKLINGFNFSKYYYFLKVMKFQYCISLIKFI